MKSKAQWRKERPVALGVLGYFPDAILEVAHTSWLGNKQHHDGKPLHWDRSKSTDQLDAAVRHITDHIKGNVIDDDGGYHLAKAAWRILAELQLVIENERNENPDEYEEVLNGIRVAYGMVFGDNPRAEDAL